MNIRPLFLKRNQGFSLPQILISLLVFSSMGLAVTKYMRSNQANLLSSDISSDIEDSGVFVQKLLSDDLRQAAFVNPGCGGVPASASTLCSDVRVQGGITPMPGVYKSGLDTATNTLTPPANLTNATSTLQNPYDGLRLVQYNFSSAFNCKLNPYASPNPSTTAGTGSGAERFQALRSGCNGNLAVNGLYLMIESINGVVYSNVFQITALTDLGGGATSSNQLQVDVASTGNIFNQVGGLGLSGFDADARIYPIKLVEWGVDASAGLYRREITPSNTNIAGYGTWNLLSDAIEGIQFYPVTVTTTAVVEHQRTMQFSGATGNSRISDIRGVSARIVVKAAKASTSATTYTNPMLSTAVPDHYQRKEMKFYVDLENYHTN